MPIPFLLCGAAVVAGVYGMHKHKEAKRTNQRAIETQDEAQHIFYAAKQKLNNAQERTKKVLVNLGQYKQKILVTSFNQFCESFRKIKNLEVQTTEGMNELARFTIDEHEAIHMRELADINANKLSTATAGAATGTLVAIAASGFAPVIGTLASGAGVALAAGELTIAGSLAGSAASVGLAATPIAAIAGPALLFSGLSASSKANANLDRALSTLSEAQAEAEKMESVVVVCDAITKRTQMFHSLLHELNMLFISASGMMTDMVNKKTRWWHFTDKVNVKKLSAREKEIIAVTRSLAGAIKVIIDTSMLSAEGELTKESQEKYEEVRCLLPAYQQKVVEIKDAGYEVIVDSKTQSQKKGKARNKVKSSQKRKSKIITVLLALFLGFFGAHRFYLRSWKIGFCYLIAILLGQISWCVLFAFLDALYFMFMGKEKFNRKYDIK